MKSQRTYYSKITIKTLIPTNALKGSYSNSQLIELLTFKNGSYYPDPKGMTLPQSVDFFRTTLGHREVPNNQTKVASVF